MKLLQPNIKLKLLKATRENDVFWNVLPFKELLSEHRFLRGKHGSQKYMN